VHTWRKQLLEQGAQVFGKAEASGVNQAEQEQKERSLYEKIGQLTVERDFLKKASGKLRGSRDAL
jgi:transposase